jgi:predicted transposase YdaD
VLRKAMKWEITRRLYERGHSKENVLELFRLIDWLLHLPEQQRIEFRREVFEYEASKHMPYITSIEEMGRQEGRLEGRQEGRQEGRREGLREGAIIALQKAVLDALEVRFGEAPKSLRQTIEATQDEAGLRSLHRSAIQAASFEAFARELEE